MSRLISQRILQLLCMNLKDAMWSGEVIFAQKRERAHSFANLNSGEEEGARFNKQV